MPSMADLLEVYGSLMSEVGYARILCLELCGAFHAEIDAPGRYDKLAHFLAFSKEFIAEIASWPQMVGAGIGSRLPSAALMLAFLCLAHKNQYSVAERWAQ